MATSKEHLGKSLLPQQRVGDSSKESIQIARRGRNVVEAKIGDPSIIFPAKKIDYKCDVLERKLRVSSLTELRNRQFSVKAGWTVSSSEASEGGKVSYTKRKVQVSGESFDIPTGFYDYFWSQVEEDNWESGTFETLGRLITNETVFVDIGAWIGPITLFAGRHAQSLIAIEPDPNAFETLKLNVFHNEHTMCQTNLINAALWNESSESEVALRPMGFVGDSMSSIVRQKSKPGGKNEFTAKVLTVPHLIARLTSLQPKNLVLKMDIEGGEYEILPELTSALASLPLRVNVLVSLHPQILRTNVSGRLPRRFLQGVETFRLCKKLSRLGRIQTTHGSQYRFWRQSFQWFISGNMDLDFCLEFPPCGGG